MNCKKLIYIFMLIPIIISAEIYVHVDKRGNIFLSDRKRDQKYTKVSDYQFNKKQKTDYDIYDFEYNAKKYYLNTIKRLSKKHNVDYRLITAIVKIESNFDRYAVSNKGACGLMQLMPSTADELGVTDVFDPVKNIDGGIRYFKELHNNYNNTKLALAAYNAGPNNVKKYNYNIPPFKETRRYIKKVLDYYNYLKLKKQERKTKKYYVKKDDNGKIKIVFK